MPPKRERGSCNRCGRPTPEDPRGWEPIAASGRPIPPEDVFREALNRLGDDALRRVLAADDLFGQLSDEVKRAGSQPFPAAVAWLCPDCLKKLGISTEEEG